MKQTDAFIDSHDDAAHNTRVSVNVLLCIFVQLMYGCKRHDLTADHE